ncbi:MAG: F0F1 ATP synthase subunit delta [Candidatus Omnitrophica bacterium]|nr:F0F1 ATP synthase subunit delta [Candidatus Omnitrophota bacterium]
MFILQFVVLQVVLFVGLAVLLRRVMGRHATKATAHLQGLSQDYLRKQEELKKRLEEAERLYQEQLAKAQEEAHQLKTQARQEAEAARQQVVEQARQEAERIVQQAVQAREALQRELAQAMEAKAVERACELIQDILPRELREAAHTPWLDELITNGLITVERLESREQIREARAVSAFPLTSAQRKRLLERLQELLGSPVTLQESVDPHLLAGLTITIGHLVLDGSLSSKLREAVRHAQDAP